MPEHDTELATDLLRGAESIAFYMYGDKKLRRKIYHLMATSNAPFFKIGSMICARKSILLKWIEDREQSRASDHHTCAGKTGTHM